MTKEKIIPKLDKRDFVTKRFKRNETKINRDLWILICLLILSYIIFFYTNIPMWIGVILSLLGFFKLVKNLFSKHLFGRWLENFGFGIISGGTVLFPTDWPKNLSFGLFFIISGTICMAYGYYLILES